MTLVLGSKFRAEIRKSSTREKALWPVHTGVDVEFYPLDFVEFDEIECVEFDNDAKIESGTSE